MRLLATGLNAHGQINDSKDDVFEFEEVSRDVTSIALCTWSTLSWTVGSSLRTRGHAESSPANEPASTRSSARKPECVFGDHNGIIGIIQDTNIRCPSGGCVTVYKREQIPGIKLMQVAVAGNGRCAAVYNVASDIRPSMKVCEYVNTADMISTWGDHGVVGPRGAVFTIPGHVRRLEAGATSFMLLTNHDEVYTWGDVTRCSLGRSKEDDDGRSTAHIPGKVPALDGVKIKKVCHGGWFFGAVSEDGAAYLWGYSTHGCADYVHIKMQLDTDEDVALVTLAANVEDEPDVIDMDIGDGHIAMVTSNGKLLVLGSNSYGQLGLQRDMKSSMQFIMVPEIEGAVQVVCGSKMTAVLVE